MLKRRALYDKIKINHRANEQKLAAGGRHVFGMSKILYTIQYYPTCKLQGVTKKCLPLPSPCQSSPVILPLELLFLFTRKLIVRISPAPVWRWNIWAQVAPDIQEAWPGERDGRLWAWWLDGWPQRWPAPIQVLFLPSIESFTFIVESVSQRA